jgi:biopolymer transport protein ExbD
MSRRRKRKVEEVEYRDAELNIMPFIDVFSVLNTFLLFSAVFVAFGVVKVQIPYLSNKQLDEKPKRSLSVSVDIDKQKVQLVTRYSMAPINEEKTSYNLDEAGLTAMHQKLVQIRSANKDTEVVSCFMEDDVAYEQIIKVVDAIKLRRQGDPQFVTNDPDETDLENVAYVFPKVVFASVIL